MPLDLFQAAADAGGAALVLAAVATGAFGLAKYVVGVLQRAREQEKAAQRDALDKIKQAEQTAADKIEQKRQEAEDARDREDEDRRRRWEAQIDRYQTGIQQGYERAVTETQRARDESEAIRSRLHGLERRIPQLEGRVEDLETQLTASQSRVVELEKLVEVLTFERDTLAQKEAAGAAQRTFLEGQLADAKREVRRLEDVLRVAGIAVVATEPIDPAV